MYRIFFATILVTLAVTLQEAFADTFLVGPNNDLLVTVNIENMKPTFRPGEQLRVSSQLYLQGSSIYELRFEAATVQNVQVNLFDTLTKRVTPQSPFLTGVEKIFIVPTPAQGDILPKKYTVDFTVGVEEDLGVDPYVLSMTCSAFGGGGCTGNFRDSSGKNYTLEAVDTGAGIQVPAGTYEWLGGAPNEMWRCPVPSDPVDISPPVGTIVELGDAPLLQSFDVYVGCH